MSSYAIAVMKITVGHRPESDSNGYHLKETEHKQTTLKSKVSRGKWKGSFEKRPCITGMAALSIADHARIAQHKSVVMHF